MKLTIRALLALAPSKLFALFLLATTTLVGISTALAQTPPMFAIRARPGDTTYEGGGMISYTGPMGDAGGTFDINVVFIPLDSNDRTFDPNNPTFSGLTPSQQAVFALAEAFWESKIIGYGPGISLSGVTIDARGPYIDGAGTILGQAGPTSVTNQGGFSLATKGIMEFDSDDLANLEDDGSLLDVIMHEMGHVLGIGTLWNHGLNNVYVEGTGNYTGAAGLARWQTEYNRPLDTSVPVEMGGRLGTENGHWNEVDKGKVFTGITDSMGRDMRNELMTGWLDTPTHLADFTLQSLTDIGLVVVPEPGTASLALMALLTITVAGSRRPQGTLVQVTIARAASVGKR